MACIHPVCFLVLQLVMMSHWSDLCNSKNLILVHDNRTAGFHTNAEMSLSLEIISMIIPTVMTNCSHQEVVARNYLLIFKFFVSHVTHESSF